MAKLKFDLPSCTLRLRTLLHAECSNDECKDDGVQVHWLGAFFDPNNTDSYSSDKRGKRLTVDAKVSSEDEKLAAAAYCQANAAGLYQIIQLLMASHIQKPCTWQTSADIDALPVIKTKPLNATDAYHRHLCYRTDLDVPVQFIEANELQENDSPLTLRKIEGTDLCFESKYTLTLNGKWFADVRETSQLVKVIENEQDTSNERYVFVPVACDIESNYAVALQHLLLNPRLFLEFLIDARLINAPNEELLRHAQRVNVVTRPNKVLEHFAIKRVLEQRDQFTRAQDLLEQLKPHDSVLKEALENYIVDLITRSCLLKEEDLRYVSPEQLGRSLEGAFLLVNQRIADEFSDVKRDPFYNAITNMFEQRVLINARLTEEDEAFYQEQLVATQIQLLHDYTFSDEKAEERATNTAITLKQHAPAYKLLCKMLHSVQERLHEPRAQQMADILTLINAIYPQLADRLRGYQEVLTYLEQAEEKAEEKAADESYKKQLCTHKRKILNEFREALGTSYNNLFDFSKWEDRYPQQHTQPIVCAHCLSVLDKALSGDCSAKEGLPGVMDQLAAKLESERINYALAKLIRFSLALLTALQEQQDKVQANQAGKFVFKEAFRARCLDSINEKRSALLTTLKELMAQDEATLTASYEMKQNELTQCLETSFAREQCKFINQTEMIDETTVDFAAHEKNAQSKEVHAFQHTLHCLYQHVLVTMTKRGRGLSFSQNHLSLIERVSARDKIFDQAKASQAKWWLRVLRFFARIRHFFRRSSTRRHSWSVLDEKFTSHKRPMVSENPRQKKLRSASELVESGAELATVQAADTVCMYSLFHTRAHSASDAEGASPSAPGDENDPARGNLGW